MSRFTVAPEKTHLLENGKSFFYLGDTAWMAFSNLTEQEFADYARVRKSQGFNVLQISILPVTHDTSMGPTNLAPFLTDSGGNWDTRRMNPAYFDRAERMAAVATELDLALCLGVLWCSYVPGTRCSSRSPVASAMPENAVEPYVRAAANRFAPYDPLFFISGDTQFESDEEPLYYMKALETVREICPDALLTMHLTPSGELDASFQKAVDFYMYQSGHNAECQDTPYRLSQKFRDYPVTHPVINGEPCYEGHGMVGTQNRFSARAVRKAIWQSLLSGASMGVTYGGHGVWSFHKPGMRFLNADRSFEPYHWRDALELPGARDAGYARWVFEEMGLVGARPMKGVNPDDPEVAGAVSADGSSFAVYAPETTELELPLDLKDYRCTVVDMTRRRHEVPRIHTGATSRLEIPRFNGDSLLLGRRK